MTPPRTLSNRIWYSLVWSVCWAFSLVWFRFRYLGRANVPKNGPVLLVSNHQSYLDPVLVGLACPRPVGAMARHSLFFWPLGPLIRMLGAVPVDRERGAVSGFKATLKMLRDGQAVLVFPEGTRTPDGRLQPFMTGFCALARRGNATIVPVAIDGAFEAMRRGSIFPRPRLIELVFCRPISSQQVGAMADEDLVAVVSDRIRESSAR